MSKCRLLLRTDPAEFEKNVEKLRAEKEREIELKKQDAEDALNRARELKAKVCMLSELLQYTYCSTTVLTMLIFLSIRRSTCKTHFAGRFCIVILKLLSFQGLDGIVKLDFLRERAADEIKAIWLEHHKTKKCIYGVIRVRVMLISYDTF